MAGTQLLPADGVVTLAQFPSGDLIRVPSAAEIFSAAVLERPDVFSPKLVRPVSETCPGVLFEQARAAVELVVRSTTGGLFGQIEVVLPSGDRFSLDRGPHGPDHTLVGDRWIPMEQDELDALDKTLVQAGVAIPGRIPLRSYRVLLKAASNLIRIDLRVPNDFMRELTQDVPPSFAGDLHEYQSEGYAWLAFCLESAVGCILADEMGLGKTVEIIAVLADAIARGNRPHLIVAPATILENWRREIGRFAPGLRVLIHSGPKRTGDPSRLETLDVVVMSWGTMLRDLGMLRSVRWHGVFLDEAQAAKNPDTEHARLARRIPARATFPVTGTPIENRLLDLCSLLSIASQNVFDDPVALAQEWTARSEEFSQLCRPFLLRRTVAQVGSEMPSLVQSSEVLQMLPMEAEIYFETRARNVGDRRSQLALLTMLRRLCAHPSLVRRTDADPSSVSTKYQRLCEILGQLSDASEKALVAAPWHDLSDLMLRDLRARFKMWLGLIDGRVPADKRQAIVDAFTRAGGFAVLLLAPKAAGVGLNIPAAHHVIHYVPDWNPAVQDQLTARARRKGQTRPVFERLLYYEGTVEEAIMRLLDRKRQLATRVVKESGDKWGDVSQVLSMTYQLSPAPSSSGVDR